MDYTDFSSVVLGLIGVAVIIFRTPLAKLQLLALVSIDYFKKNPSLHLKRLKLVAIFFGVLFIAIAVIRYLGH
jgi:energy-converting hydrogenase Eha subunit C